MKFGIYVQFRKCVIVILKKIGGEKKRGILDDENIYISSKATKDLKEKKIRN